MPSSLSPHVCVCCRVQDGSLPLHCAAHNNESEAVIKAVLAAYPDAAKAMNNVRCGRGQRVLCPLLFAPHTCAPCPLPRPFSLASVQDRKRPKDYAKTDTIKALLKVKGKWGGWMGRAVFHIISDLCERKRISLSEVG